MGGDFRLSSLKGNLKANDNKGVLGSFVEGVGKSFKACRGKEVGIAKDKDFGLGKKSLKGKLVIKIFRKPVITPKYMER